MSGMGMVAPERSGQAGNIKVFLAEAKGAGLERSKKGGCRGSRATSASWNCVLQGFK